MTASAGILKTSAPFVTSASLAYIALLPYLASVSPESSASPGATNEYTPTPTNAPPLAEIHLMRLTSVFVGNPPGPLVDAGSSPGFGARAGDGAAASSTSASEDDARSASVASTTAARMTALIRSIL